MNPRLPVQFLAPLLALQVPPATAPAPTAAPTTAATTAPATTAPATSAPATSAPATTIAATPPSAPVAATLPATAPTLDQSSPKALLRSFFASHGEVDDATIRSLLHAANDLEQKVLDSVVQVELANTRLRQAEREKFGKATTAPSVAGRLEPANLSELDSFIEKIEGDRATVTVPRDPTAVMNFVRVEGKWKLPIASPLGPLTPAVVETMGAAARAQIEIIHAVTAEVRAGTLTSEEQVREALSKRLVAKIASTPPATAPATVPAVSSPAPSPATQPAK